MSGMEACEGPEGPVSPHGVTGAPPPAPRLLGSGDGAEGGGAGHGAEVEPAEEKLPEVSDYPSHANNAEKIVAYCFLLAFSAGCGFIAAYIGLEVHSPDATLRSNLALGFSLSVALLGLGVGSLIWVRQLMPGAELTETRRGMRSATKDRQACGEYFAEGAGASKLVKRPVVRRTLLLATLPLAAIPVVVLRDLGPLPGTSLRHTVWSPGRRLLV